MIKTPQMGVLATWMIPRSIERTREFERHGLSDLPGQKDLKDPFIHYSSAGISGTGAVTRRIQDLLLIWPSSACARKVNPM